MVSGSFVGGVVVMRGTGAWTEIVIYAYQKWMDTTFESDKGAVCPGNCGVPLIGFQFDGSWQVTVTGAVYVCAT